MRLEIGNWAIRGLRRQDAPALVKYANNRKISTQLRDRFPFPYTEKDAMAWLQRVSQEDPEVSFGIASPLELIGGIGLELQEDIYRRSAEIGYWLGEPYWGKGIATLAVGALTDWAFAELGLVRVFATVFESNPASARVLDKVGYSCEGRLRQSITKEGQTFDSFLYAAIRPPNLNRRSDSAARGSPDLDRFSRCLPKEEAE
ncbi:MAG: GNAT family protein [Thermoanaerobaculia bacterium]